MDAVKPARVPPGRAGLGAEAVRQADVLDRQLQFVEDLVAVHAAERDLGRGDEAQVGVRQAVDLRLRAARHEADAFEHLDAGHVRRDDRRVALFQERLQGVLHQGQFQQHRLVLEVVELLPGHRRSGLEIRKVKTLGQGDVILDGKVEGRLARPRR